MSDAPSPDVLLARGRRLGQESRVAEDAGDLARALDLNQEAIDTLLAAGDGPGLLIAFRSRAFLLLRQGRVEAGLTALARGLALALQLQPEQVMQTLEQIVGVGGYLATERPADLLALSATMRTAVDHVRDARGDFPTELVGPVQLAGMLGNIYGALGLLEAHEQGSESLSEVEVERLCADSITQGWAVDALSRQAWGIVPWLKEWLVGRGFAVDE